MLVSFFESRFVENNEYFKKNPLNTAYWIGIIFIIFIVGFRWNMATDWDAYYEIYQISSTNEYIAIEKGFLLLNSFFLKNFNDYQFFLIFHAIVFYVVIFKFFKFFTHYVAFAILWHFASSLGIVGSSRQLLALAIGSVGLLHYLKKGNKTVFIVSVLLAMTFHTSAIFMFFYLFLNRHFTKNQLIIAILTSVVVGYIDISGFVVSNVGVLGQLASDKAGLYSAESFEYSYLAIFKRLIIILPLILILRNRIEHRKFSNIVINGYIFGICLYLTFGQSLNIIATRGAMYFNIMEPIIITYYLYLVSDRISKHIAIFLISLFSLLLLRQSISQYPQIFVPYKNRFFQTDIFKY